METPAMALRSLGVAVDHLFSCDVNKHAKTTIMANFPPKVFYDDLTVRDNTKAPKADLYVAGFPCQPFSTAGKQQGFADARGRGEIFWHVRDYIEQRQPKVFVLENVSGLVKINGGEYFRAIMEALEALGSYNVYHQMMDTKQHGVPQSRRRIYILGIRKACDDGSFSFPEPVETPSIEAFLDPKPRMPQSSALPPASQTTARTNVKQALKALMAKGCNPLKTPYVVDCDSPPRRSKYLKGVSPCMTCSRAGGHWVTSRMRRMNKAEMLRLQGMDPASFKVAVSEAQLGKQIGNAMSVNVLERLFVRVLPAAGLVRHGALRDRWEAGKTPRELTGAHAKRRLSMACTGGAKRVKV
uniref:DNA (cytosine-5-)-methyltransferase n=1 Tax=Alexandrium catenella TaxID=2925 RepID=A0A7S1MC65_ALECA